MSPREKKRTEELNKRFTIAATNVIKKDVSLKKL